MSLVWKIISHFLVNAEMRGFLEAVSNYLADTLYKRLTYCQTSGKNGALAFFHTTLVYTGATENQDFLKSWLNLGLALNLGRKWSYVPVSWLSTPLVSFADFEYYFSIQRKIVE